MWNFLLKVELFCFFPEQNFINFSHWILQNQIYEPNILLLNNVIAYLVKKTFKAYVLSSFIKNNCCIRNYIRTVFATNLQRIRLVETNDSSLFHYLSKESHRQTCYRGSIPQSLKYSYKVSQYAKHSKLLQFIEKSIMYSLSSARPCWPLSLSFHLPLNPEYFMNSSHQEEESKEGSCCL